MFFRWIKQRLNLSTLFGTTLNAVYGQLFTALLIYVLLKHLFDEVSPLVPSLEQTWFATFVRLLGIHDLSAAWTLQLWLYTRDKLVTKYG
ncbi:hypothetical protein [Paenibacillus puerhi]|uniref:hypothetical protein n=1 Tax=Paenibacillus puerhi TaxID=2692622 RepID=UPI0038B27A2D